MTKKGSKHSKLEMKSTCGKGAKMLNLKKVAISSTYLLGGALLGGGLLRGGLLSSGLSSGHLSYVDL
jgi:hypothetical protein